MGRAYATRIVSLALAATALSGCHLLLPNGTGAPQHDAGADGPVHDVFHPPDVAIDGLAQPACGPTGWCWELPLSLPSNTINDMFTQASGETLAVGGRGTLLSRNSQGEWKVVPLDIVESLYGVSEGAGSSVLVGDRVIVERDGPTAWRPQTFPNVFFRGVYVSKIPAVSPAAFAVGSDLNGGAPVAVVYARFGGAWSEVVRDETIPTFSAVHGSSESDVVVVGPESSFYHYDGDKWTSDKVPTSIPGGAELVSVWTDGNVTIVGGADDQVYMLDGTWAQLPINEPCPAMPCNTQITDISGPNEASLFITTLDGRIFHKQGNQLVSIPRATVAGVANIMSTYAVVSSGPNDVTVAGSHGSLRYYDGVQWSNQRGGSESTIFAGNMLGDASDSEVFAMPLNRVQVSRNGAPWVSEANLGINVVGSWRISSTRLMAVGQGIAPNIGPYLQIREGGAWSSLVKPDPTAAGVFTSAWGSGPNDIYVVGFEGVWRWDGVTWTKIHTTSDAVVCDVGKEAALGVGGGGGLVVVVGTKFENPAGFSNCDVGDGRVWFCDQTSCTADAQPPSTLVDVWGDAQGRFMAVGANGLYMQYDAANPGLGWITAKLSPANKSNISFRRIAARAIDDLYATFGDGEVAHWDGSTWTLEKTATTNFLWSLWFSADGRKLYAAGNGGTVVSTAIAP